MTSARGVFGAGNLSKYCSSLPYTMTPLGSGRKSAWSQEASTKPNADDGAGVRLNQTSNNLLRYNCAQLSFRLLPPRFCSAAISRSAVNRRIFWFSRFTDPAAKLVRVEMAISAIGEIREGAVLEIQ